MVELRFSQNKRNAAHPPFQAILLVSSVLVCCILFSPKLSSIDSVATFEIMSSPLFDDVMSKYTLAYIRLTTATCFFLITAFRASKRGIVIMTPYLKDSKLKRIPINIDGWRGQVMFTQWCWNLLTISFGLNGYITFRAAQAEDLGIEPLLFPMFPETGNRIILRSATMLFEIVAPTSLLVSSVVRYALWPAAMNTEKGSEGLKKWYVLAAHNANLVSTLFEVGVLGRLPVRLADCSIAPTYGIIYIIFTWSVSHYLVPSGDPQFVYFFFDTTLPPKKVLGVLISLLVILMIFYLLFTLIDDVLDLINGGMMVNSILLLGFASLFCRFND